MDKNYETIRWRFIQKLEFNLKQMNINVDFKIINTTLPQLSSVYQQYYEQQIYSNLIH